MLRIAGERTGGTILWMADERAIADYVVPRVTEAAEAALVSVASSSGTPHSRESAMSKPGKKKTFIDYELPTNAPVSSISLTFSENLSAAMATNPACYDLRGAGPPLSA